ncbi:hypothetical protein GCM10027430_33180 [Lysobacter tyrosinilyticus]
MLVRLDNQLQQAETQYEAARTLCEFTGRELNLADCVVYLPSGGDGLTQAAVWGPKRGTVGPLESGIRLPIGTGIVGECARQLRTQRVDDTRRDLRYFRDDQARLSELSVPICHDEILLAVLDSEDGSTGFYDVRYEQAFEAIADHSAAHLWRLRALGAP